MEVTVSPDMQFYNLLESYPYSPTSALCEYIDNALQAFLDYKKSDLKKNEKLKIELNFHNENDDQHITIRDHGIGIEIENIQNALKPAYAVANKSLSEFGIGMKAASVWFGRKWILKSYPISNKKGFEVVFDLDTLLLNNTDKIAVDIFEKELKATGIEITLQNLKRSIDKDMVDNIWRDLQEIYQLFIFRDNPNLDLIVKFNGTKLALNTTLKGYSPEILKYPTAMIHRGKPVSYGEQIVWRQELNFEFNHRPVTGFLCVLKTASQINNPGLRLFRYKRLIRGSEYQPYRPISLLGTPNKHAPSRVYGELYLDGQPISNHKGEFQFDERFFLQTLKSIPGVEELINQAEFYRANAVRDKEVEHFETISEYEKFAKRDDPEKPSKSTKKSKKELVKKSDVGDTVTTYIEILKSRGANTRHLLSKSIISEAVQLYEENRWWPFTLCYRIILEVGILKKIEILDAEAYSKCQEKSIVGLVNFLASNANLVDAKYTSLKRVLKGNALQNIPQIDLMNLASHGHYQPFKADTDLLIANTQSLLEWIYED